jgi:hypothetical protein
VHRQPIRGSGPLPTEARAALHCRNLYPRRGITAWTRSVSLSHLETQTSLAPRETTEGHCRLLERGPML